MRILYTVIVCTGNKPDGSIIYDENGADPYDTTDQTAAFKFRDDMQKFFPGTDCKYYVAEVRILP